MEGCFGIKVLTQVEHAKESGSSSIYLSCAEDPLMLRESLRIFNRVVIEIRGLSDSQAYIQAILLRRRMLFDGDLRAVGDIRPEQLLCMARAGFSSAVLDSGRGVTDTLVQIQRLYANVRADATGEYMSW